MRRLRAGGNEADEALCDLIFQIRKPLMAFLCRHGATTDHAENIVHDTFLKAQEKVGTFRGEAKVSSWLYQIALRLLTDSQRRESRWVDVQLSLGSDGEEIDVLTMLIDTEASAPSTEDIVELRRLQSCLAENYPRFRRDHPDRADDLENIVTHGWSTEDLAAFRGEAGDIMRKRLQRHRDVLRGYLAPCKQHYRGRSL